MADTPAKKTTKTATAQPVTATATAANVGVVDNKAEAKTRFNRALDEAKAGAAALRDEAKVRADGYRGKAKAKGDTYRSDAEDYAGQAKVKAVELARDGKTKVSDGLSGLGKLVSDNAATLDEKFGPKYGDYARTASRSLQETAVKLDNKELDELAEDARAAVRKSPGLAVGLAAVAGYMLARLFTSNRD